MTQAIVTDIEGTTTSLSFVHDVLFPYAREHLAGFVRDNAQAPPVREALAQVNDEVNARLGVEQAIEQLIEWIDQDKKITPLKSIQGLIWRHGYENGDYQGHVYEDAYRNLRRWHDDGLALYVYSSGSVQAQQLLFKYSTHGDMTPLFRGYFDTRTGAKRDAVSYRNILTEIHVPAAQCLFLSDINAELDAAREAHMQTICLDRGDAVNPQAAGSHRVVANFDEIRLNA